MNTEILFRGKQFGTSDWVYGSLITTTIGNTKTWISHSSRGNGGWFNIGHRCYVIPETVGQYINLTDKNGNKAFVGDIFKDDKGVLRTIFCIEGGFAMESNPLSFGYGYQHNLNPSEPLANQQTASWFKGNCEVVGNVFDNLEMLG